MENFLGVAVNHILVGDAEDAYGNGILGDNLGDHRAKTAELGMLLDGDDTASIGSSLTDGLFVAGFQPRHIQHTRADAFGSQLFAGLHRMPNGFAGSNNREVLTVLQLIGFAGLEGEVVVCIDIVDSTTTHAHIDGMRIVDEHLHQTARLTGIGRKHHLHTREGAQHGNVVQTVVSGTKRAIGHTARNAEYGDGILGIGQVNLYLLQRAGHIETGRTAAEHLLSAMCQSGRNTYGILFGNSALHELLGQFLGIVAKRYRTTSVGGYGNDIFVLLCQFQQSLCKCFSTSFHNLLYK